MSSNGHHQAVNQDGFVHEYPSYVSMHLTDAAGVVYLGAPSQWAQVGLENLFRGAGHPIESTQHTNVHFPMVRQTIDHFHKLRLGEAVVVRTWVDRVGTRSFTIATEVSKPDGPVHIRVEFTAVTMGRDGTKPSVETWIRELNDQAREAGLTSDAKTEVRP